jgi:type IV fimbrial biogenesis protein FimT
MKTRHLSAPPPELLPALLPAPGPALHSARGCFSSWRVYPRGLRGFTMVELMVVLVIAGILLGIGAPALTELIRRNRVVAEVNNLRASLSNARSEALAQRAFVTVCPTNGGAACADTTDWAPGFIAFVDFDGDSVLDAADDRLIENETAARDGISVVLASTTAQPRVRFDAQGSALGFAGTYTVCDDGGEAEDARALVVANSGQIRSGVDSNGNGVVEGLGGNVSCP